MDWEPGDVLTLRQGIACGPSKLAHPAGEVIAAGAGSTGPGFVEYGGYWVDENGLRTGGSVRFYGGSVSHIDWREV